MTSFSVPLPCASQPTYTIDSEAAMYTAYMRGVTPITDTSIWPSTSTVRTATSETVSQETNSGTQAAVSRPVTPLQRDTRLNVCSV